MSMIPIEYGGGKIAYVNSHVLMDKWSHGGHSAEHKAEMEEIANEIVDKKIAAVLPEVQRQAYQRAVNGLLDALKVDLNTVVNVAFENGEDIFHSSKTQQVIMNALYDKIQKGLEGDYKINL